MTEKQTPWTAGPWHLDESGIVADDWGLVAIPGYPETLWERGGGEMTPDEQATADANARLIAAAPEQFGIIKDFIDWVDRFTGTLPEAQSEALFDIYRRARSTYRNVDQDAHDASREAAILQARGEAG